MSATASPFVEVGGWEIIPEVAPKPIADDLFAEPVVDVDEGERWAKAVIDALVSEAVLRPLLVIAVPEDFIDDGRTNVARLRVPEGLSPTAALIVELAIVPLANRRLADGERIEWSLDRLPLGRDLCARRLAEAGHPRDRSTVADALLESGHRPLKLVGQQQSWMDGHAPKSGSFVYSVVVTCRKLGDLAKRAIGRLAPPGAFTWTSSAGVGGEGRMAAYLGGLVRHAKEGNRNQGGYMLARRCIEAGLPRARAHELARTYHGRLVEKGVAAGYGLAEAGASVDSAYRYHAA